MKKFIPKIIALGVAMTVTVASINMDISAASLSAGLPVAGIARVLNEGKSVTSVKADQIKIKNRAEAEIAGNTSGDGILMTAGAGSGAASDDYSFGSKISTIKETVGTSEPALITVGAASVTVNQTISQNMVLSKSANLESEEIKEETLEEDEETTADEEYADEESADDDDLVDATTSSKNQDDEDFSNLVIARVNDYVNVREEPSEESEIVGKLYNKSVGDLLEEAGDWYKIKSGNCTGYVKGEYVVTGDEAVELAKEVGTRMAKVTTTTLYVREEPSTESEVIGMVPIDDALTVSEELDGWAKVSVEEGDGYVSTEFVKLYTEFVHAESKAEEEARLAKEEAARKAAREAARKAQEKNSKKQTASGGSAPAANYVVSGSGTGSSVASYALQFVGNPYVYGGTSLTNGADCSGFVMSVYRNFGVSLPHSSGGDRNVGYNVGGLANAQPGDIVCYSGHVAIYIGGGQIVHASTPSSGIKVSNASYRNVLAVRRIF